jgi:lysozyme family protein
MGFFEWIKSLFKHKEQPMDANSTGGGVLNNVPNIPHEAGGSIPPRTSTSDASRMIEYQRDFGIARVLPEWEAQAHAQALKALNNRARYEAVANHVRSDMPWYVPAVLHMMEAAIADWNAYLGNGEHIIGTNHKSTLVPAGRGPFSTWEDGAIDALQSERIKSVARWDIAGLLNFCEGFNGMGYYHMRKRSPYLWSGTNLGIGTGKYVADGVYDPNAVSKQLGVAAVLKAMGVSG